MIFCDTWQLSCRILRLGGAVRFEFWDNWLSVLCWFRKADCGQGRGVVIRLWVAEGLLIVSGGYFFSQARTS